MGQPIGSIERGTDRRGASGAGGSRERAAARGRRARIETGAETRGPSRRGVVRAARASTARRAPALEIERWGSGVAAKSTFRRGGAGTDAARAVDERAPRASVERGRTGAEAW